MFLFFSDSIIALVPREGCALDRELGPHLGQLNNECAGKNLLRGVFGVKLD